MTDDSELLVRYCQDRSEAALTELVGRHVNTVYSSAVRQLGGDTCNGQVAFDYRKSSGLIPRMGALKMHHNRRFGTVE